MSLSGRADEYGSDAETTAAQSGVWAAEGRRAGIADESATDWGEPFSPEELNALALAVPRAQELAGEHFALTDDWFERTSHRVLSVQKLLRREILPPGALAQIRRVYRVMDEGEGRVLRCERFCPHYRICVQDHNVRARLRDDPGLDLGDLLVGVLTHEYVHLVRFCRLEHPYYAPEDQRVREEARVTAVTRAILHRSGHGGLRRLASRLVP